MVSHQSKAAFPWNPNFSGHSGIGVYPEDKTRNAIARLPERDRIIASSLPVWSGPVCRLITRSRAFTCATLVSRARAWSACLCTIIYSAACVRLVYACWCLRTRVFVDVRVWLPDVADVRLRSNVSVIVPMCYTCVGVCRWNRVSRWVCVCGPYDM